MHALTFITYVAPTPVNHLLPSNVSRIVVLSRYMNFSQSMPSEAHNLSTDLKTSCRHNPAQRSPASESSTFSNTQFTGKYFRGKILLRRIFVLLGSGEAEIRAGEGKTRSNQFPSGRWLGQRPKSGARVSVCFST